MSQSNLLAETSRMLESGVPVLRKAYVKALHAKCASPGPEGRPRLPRPARHFSARWTRSRQTRPLRIELFSASIGRSVCALNPVAPATPS